MENDLQKLKDLIIKNENGEFCLTEFGSLLIIFVGVGLFNLIVREVK